MPKVTKICKTCGKEYEACHTPNPGIMRWRDVACSPECASAYFRAVAIARGELVEDEPAVNNAEPVAEEPKRADPEVAEPVVVSRETEGQRAYTYEDEEMPRFMRNRRR